MPIAGRRLTASSLAARLSFVEVLAGEGAVDTEGCTRSFGGGDNRQLHIAEHVSSSEYAGYRGGFVLPASNATVPVQAASQLHHRGRLWS